ncbi:MAG: DUF3863 domain-containing protein [Planctomycetaceae bacterium]|jgi:hypothetical protein|nr:DUF3863 domain-containing protein [Planctomycetaceae bacterium]
MPNLDFTRRQFLQTSAAFGTACAAGVLPFRAAAEANAPLTGKRFFTFNSVIRVNQIEVSRTKNAGFDEAHIHTLQNFRLFREHFRKGCENGKMTWAFSWLALQDKRQNYADIRKQAAEYHHQYGDEVTFLPGGFFSPMYNSRKQVNADLHDALAMVSDIVGGGYRPKSVVGGFLAAENLRYLAEEEKIHAAQGNIWSQYAIDNGDGDGAMCYPYYPSREHFLKPAQGQADFIDCVNLDGWTCDFLCARRKGFAEGFNSRLGVGPIESLFHFGTEKGLQEMLAACEVHYGSGFDLNQFAWVTVCWELALMPKQIGDLTLFLQELYRRYPDLIFETQGEFALRWRNHFKDNDAVNYRFVQRGSGIGGSDIDKEIRWYMNKMFRLALLQKINDASSQRVIDFTRYDVKAEEPRDAMPDAPSRNWSLMNRLNQKQTRPVDKPILFADLTAEEKQLVAKYYPELSGA